MGCAQPGIMHAPGHVGTQLLAVGTTARVEGGGQGGTTGIEHATGTRHFKMMGSQGTHTGATGQQQGAHTGGGQQGPQGV